MPVRAEGPDPTHKTPKLQCPPGAVDTHFHLFGPADKFPYAPGSRYVSDERLPEHLFALHDRLGIEKGVFVSSGGYGSDYSYLDHVLAHHGDRLRGIALLPEDVTRDEIVRLDRLGVRGVRFVSPQHGGALPEISTHVANLCADFGWHIQYYPFKTDILETADKLLSLPVDIVLDHLAHIPAEGGPDQPAVKKVLEMLETGRVWLKLSGPMRCSQEEPPYPSVAPIAQTFVQHAPERLVWGTDWPHVNMNGRTKPNDADLLDLMLEWVPDEATRNQILSENAHKLFGF